MINPTAEKIIFGQTCYAWVTADTVEVNLPEWSGRQPLATIERQLQTLKEFVAEIEAAVQQKKALANDATA